MLRNVTGRLPALERVSGAQITLATQPATPLRMTSVMAPSADSGRLLQLPRLPVGEVPPSLGNSGFPALRG